MYVRGTGTHHIHVDYTYHRTQADTGSGAFLTPGSGSEVNNPDHIC
jgi:hypothetical protein